MNVTKEPIRRYSDHQVSLEGAIRRIRKDSYIVDSLDMRSIHGDAPKSFIKVREHTPGQACRKMKHWPEYIAKVGSKNYPTESITEHLLTRVGQSLGINIAESKLLIIADQVRFLSKYFLRLPNESLVHGLEIFRRHLDEEIVEQIAEARREQEFYTFQTVLAAVGEIYPGDVQNIMTGLVEMIAYDAIAGNNDRHPLNWGVIVPVAQCRRVRFAPVFDSARGLFWNINDSQLDLYAKNKVSMDAYIRKSFPQIGWDGRDGIDHFELIASIYRHYPKYRKNLEKFADSAWLDRCARILEREFKRLMTGLRRHTISLCLARRHELYCQSLA